MIGLGLFRIGLELLGGDDFLALGVIVLAPYLFEVSATAYLGDYGRTEASVEVEYEMLWTNRLILQPLLEVNVFGQADERRGVGSGLGTAEAGLRVRGCPSPGRSP